MPCYRPITAYYSKTVNPTGKRSLVFNPRDAQDVYAPFDIPCGQCIHCKLEKSRQWAMRCVHEASLYDQNCFLTLTYDDNKLPANGNLDYNEPVLFMKKLRKEFGEGIRSYGCAEYGEECENCNQNWYDCRKTCRKWVPQIGRPHYHLLVFNHDFEDKRLFRDQGENSLYVSNTLESLWGNGFATCGALTFETAAYTARYVSKKINGPELEGHYQRVNCSTGELGPELFPEKSVCISRRPGIGREWYERNGKYLKDHDHAIMRGKKVRPPKYYDRLFDLSDPENFRTVKSNRKIAGKIATEKLWTEKKASDTEYKSIHGQESFPITRDRLRVMEEHHELVAQQLKRGLENGKT